MALLTLYQNTSLTSRQHSQIKFVLECYGVVRNLPSRSAIQEDIWLVSICHVFVRSTVVDSSPDCTQVTTKSSIRDIVSDLESCLNEFKMKYFVVKVTD